MLVYGYGMAMKKIRWEDFDIQSYLTSKNIPYSTSGDNVSSGWIGISCLFCLDHSNHLGINLNTKVFSCFKCGETGNAVKLLQAIEQETNLGKIFRIAESFSKEGFTDTEEISAEYQEKAHLPIEATKKFSDMHLNFLKSRRYTEEVIDKYDLYATGPIGFYKHRIIIPVYMRRTLMGFVGRDVSGISLIPYKNSSSTHSVKNIKHCLYNIDNVPRKTVVIVEGILDAWRIGDGAVATFGTKYTHDQLLFLKGMDKVFVLFDADAVSLAYKLAHDIATIITSVEVLELSDGDPDNLSEKEVKELRKVLKL